VSGGTPGVTADPTEERGQAREERRVRKAEARARAEAERARERIGRAAVEADRAARRVRMSGPQRREQLIAVALPLFAAKGFEAVSIEEIASRAGVSKPIVYEHFGGKEGLFAVIVDREVGLLLTVIEDALQQPHPYARLQSAVSAFFDYLATRPDGFRVIVRDAPADQDAGAYAGLLRSLTARVEQVLRGEFAARGVGRARAGVVSHALVGAVVMAGQGWLESGRPRRQDAVTEVVDLLWHGLAGLPRPGGPARN